MTNSFSSLKKGRSKQFDKLNSQLQKLSNQGPGDDRFWKLEVDKSDNGYAIIRFLPAPQGEDIPFVRIWDHGFQGPGGWYIENSRTTIGEDDPVSEYNSELWNSTTDDESAARKQARKQKRRLSYYANIYVVHDPANPANEGKVFLYKFGKKIFDKINDAMNPEYPDEDPMNPFDFWEGANFKLKSRNYEGWRNYDKSEFDKAGTLAKPDGSEMSDDELKEVWEQQYSLQELVDPSNFKSYDELKAKLYKVLGLDGANHAPKPRAEDDEGEMDFSPKFKEQNAPDMDEAPSPQQQLDDDDDDENLDYFKSLAESD